MSIVIKNATIYTADEKNPWAGMLVVNGDTLSYVGNDDEEKWMAAVGAGAKTHDLGGRTVIPGIVDSHIHPGMCSKSAWHVRLPWTEDVDELLDFVRLYAEAHPKEEAPFLYFEYYPTSMFDQNGPTKELLDKAVSDRPCLCQDFGEHLCWVNSKMLELLGVDHTTPDPGVLEVFVRDAKGNPTGWVKEMAWLHFSENIYDAIGWTPPEELTAERMKPFFEFLKKCGITAIFDGFIETDMQIKSIR